MVGLSKIVTVLVTAMAVLCLAGIAGPAFAQTYSDPMYGGKGIASSNVGMGKGIPQTANMAANANAGMSKGGYGGGYSAAPSAYGSTAANVGGYGGKGIASSNVGMGKGIPQTANVGANANAGLSKGVSKGGYGGYGMDMGFSPYGLGCGCGSCGFGWC